MDFHADMLQWDNSADLFGHVYSVCYLIKITLRLRQHKSENNDTLAARTVSGYMTVTCRQSIICLSFVCIRDKSLEMFSYHTFSPARGHAFSFFAGYYRPRLFLRSTS